MSCRFSKFDFEEGRYYCSMTDDQCMFYVADEKLCYEKYQEGPLAFDLYGDD